MKNATIVVDLGFGDSGKGTIVDFLSRTKDVAAVVRFNGGGQAAHNVITPDGRHHTFSLFGSGTFVPGIRTHLSRFVLFDPSALRNEAQHLETLGCEDPFAKLSIDETALVVTPFQKAANRLREILRNKNRHGSCGMGIGETMADSLRDSPLAMRVGVLRNRHALHARLHKIQEEKREEFRDFLGDLKNHPVVKKDVLLLTDPHAPEFFADAFSAISGKLSIVSGDYLRQLSTEGELVFEGAQGVLLDELYGFHPYTTWSTTTFANAFELLREIDYDGQVEKLGVFRTYFTRHGAGPFPTEDKELSRTLPDVHNGAGQWQGNLRVGWFDEVLARYALAVCGGVDTLAITHVDRLKALPKNFVCREYATREGKVESLKLKSDFTDLLYQEVLTKLLNRAVPIYEESPVNTQQFLSMIESDLQTPISIVSSGPTANEKQIFKVTSREKVA